MTRTWQINERFQAVDMDGVVFVQFRFDKDSAWVRWNGADHFAAYITQRVPCDEERPLNEALNKGEYKNSVEAAYREAWGDATGDSFDNLEQHWNASEAKKRLG